MNKKKLLGFALASALTVSGLGLVAPTESSAAATPLYKMNFDSNPIKINHVTFKSETEVLKAYEGAVLEDLRVRRDKVNNEAGLFRELVRAQQLKDHRTAENILEKARVAYNKDKVKDPKGAANRWNTANSAYRDSVNKANVYYKNSLDGVERKYAQDLNLLNLETKAAHQHIEKVRLTAKNSIGKAEIQNALSLLNQYRVLQMRNVDAQNSYYRLAFNQNIKLTDLRQRTAEIELETRLVQGKLNATNYAAMKNNLKKELDTVRTKLARDLQDKNEIRSIQLKLIDQTWNSSNVYLQKLLSQTK